MKTEEAPKEASRDWKERAIAAEAQRDIAEARLSHAEKEHDEARASADSLGKAYAELQNEAQAKLSQMQTDIVAAQGAAKYAMQEVRESGGTIARLQDSLRALTQQTQKGAA